MASFKIAGKPVTDPSLIGALSKLSGGRDLDIPSAEAAATLVNRQVDKVIGWGDYELAKQAAPDLKQDEFVNVAQALKAAFPELPGLSYTFEIPQTPGPAPAQPPPPAGPAHVAQPAPRDADNRWASIADMPPPEGELPRSSSIDANEVSERRIPFAPARVSFDYNAETGQLRFTGERNVTRTNEAVTEIFSKDSAKVALHLATALSTAAAARRELTANPAPSPAQVEGVVTRYEKLLEATAPEGTPPEFQTSLQHRVYCNAAFGAVEALTYAASRASGPDRTALLERAATATSRLGLEESYDYRVANIALNRAVAGQLGREAAPLYQWDTREFTPRESDGPTYRTAVEKYGGWFRQ